MVVDDQSPSVPVFVPIPAVYIPIVTEVAPIPTDKLEITWDNGAIRFSCEPRLVLLRRSGLEKKHPKISESIAKYINTSTVAVTLDTERLKNTIKRVSALRTDKFRPITFFIEGSRARITATAMQGKDCGEFAEEIEGTSNGTGIASCCLQASYVLDFLNRSGNEVTIHCRPGEGEPVILSSTGIRSLTMQVITGAAEAPAPPASESTKAVEGPAEPEEDAAESDPEESEPVAESTEPAEDPAEQLTNPTEEEGNTEAE
jgi:hypothetical protein